MKADIVTLIISGVLLVISGVGIGVGSVLTAVSAGLMGFVGLCLGIEGVYWQGRGDAYKDSTRGEER